MTPIPPTRGTWRVSSVRFPPEPDSVRAGTGAAREQRLPTAFQVLQVLQARPGGEVSVQPEGSWRGRPHPTWTLLTRVPQPNTEPLTMYAAAGNAEGLVFAFSLFAVLYIVQFIHSAVYAFAYKRA